MTKGREVKNEMSSETYNSFCTSRGSLAYFFGRKTHLDTDKIERLSLLFPLAVARLDT